MDIYILHDGKELGPFSEVTIQTLLKQGSVQLTDPAWRPGMEQWTPLHSVLYPAASTALHVRPPLPQTVAAAPPAPPAPAPVAPPAPAAPMMLDSMGEPQSPVAVAPPAVAPASVAFVPATDRQRAFLAYMGLPVPENLSKEAAALAVTDAMEDPKEPERLARWNTDRLRLHPELFAAEIQAKKENRPATFLQLVQSEGAASFSKVTKAHCQVIIGLLDVRFPNWDDEKPEDALRKYFFPAIAEKFPALVAPSAKGKFKYPVVAKAEAEAVPKPRALPGAPRPQAVPVARVAKSAPSSPMSAVVRGLAIGLAILAAYYVFKEAKNFVKKGISDRSEVPGIKSSGASGQGNPAPSEPTPRPSDPAPPPVIAANPPVSVPEVPAVPAVPEVPIAPTNPTATPVPTKPAGPVGPKTMVRITKPVEVQLPFGKAMLQPGNRLKIVGVEGTRVKAKYGNDVVSIPAASTDINEAPPPPPPAPVVAPHAVPAAPPTSVAPVAPAAEAPAAPAAPAAPELPL